AARRRPHGGRGSTGGARRVRTAVSQRQLRQDPGDPSVDGAARGIARAQAVAIHPLIGGVMQIHSPTSAGLVAAVLAASVVASVAAQEPADPPRDTVVALLQLPEGAVADATNS